ncbi:MAG: hypothetical protein R3B60_02150 [Candidatus Paceibacterota bacterium]
MGLFDFFFGSSKPKRITKDEWNEIRLSLYNKLDEEEKVELEKFFRADLSEPGIESGISRAEFESGMAWLRSNMGKHEFEEEDLVQIEKYFGEHLKD